MAINQLLKRHFWAVTLVLIAIAAFLDAQGVTQIVGATLAADDKQLTAAPLSAKVAPGAGTAVTQKATSAEAILSRNPFDHVTGSLNKPVFDDKVDSAPPQITDVKSVPACDGVKVLVIMASADPEWSFAALSAPGDPKSKLLR